MVSVWSALALVWLSLSAATAAKAIKDVVIVFSTHLDVGFGGFPRDLLDTDVINTYFSSHFPNALDTADQLQKEAGRERYVYTTHSWLLSLFFDCPQNMDLVCPSPDMVTRMERAIRRGQVTWHAMPFNTQVELFDKQLLNEALDLTLRLDEKFDLPPKITMSQRDVPGLTSAAIPILKARGVVGISVGVNGASAPPGVPRNRPFFWKDPVSKEQLIALWHPGGYSGQPVDRDTECVQAHYFDKALCFAWRQDNQGAHSVDEVKEIFELVRSDFPGAKVRAGRMDDWMKPFSEIAGPKTRVFEDEIGDTWIYGVASDPRKMSEYRELLRVRRKASAEERASKEYKLFTRQLLKLPEHTWGASMAAVVSDYRNWSNADFHPIVESQRADVHNLTLAWLSQRRYIDRALEALGHSTLGKALAEALARLRAAQRRPRGMKEQGWERVSLKKHVRAQSRHWNMILDRESGAFRQLRSQNRHWQRPECVSGACRTLLNWVKSLGDGYDLQQEGDSWYLVQHTNGRPVRSERQQTGGEALGLTSDIGDDFVSSRSRRLLRFGTDGDGGRTLEDRKKAGRELWMALNSPQRGGSTSQTVVTVNPMQGTRRRSQNRGEPRTEPLRGGMDILRIAMSSPTNQEADPLATAFSFGSKLEIGTQVGDGLNCLQGMSEADLQRLMDGDEVIRRTVDELRPHEWTVPSEPFGKVQYRTYAEANFDVFWNKYTWVPGGFKVDFGKPNCTEGGAVHGVHYPKLVAAWRKIDRRGSASLKLKLKFAPELVRFKGAPEAVWVEIDSHRHDIALHIDVVLERKTMTRLPEATWLRWMPDQNNVQPKSWRLSKLGSPVDPALIMVNGSRGLHAVDDGGATVLSGRGKQKLVIRSLDAPLVGLGSPSPFPRLTGWPELWKGISHCLHNNIWGTNYPAWYPYVKEDATTRYRFTLQVEGQPACG